MIMQIRTTNAMVNGRLVIQKHDEESLSILGWDFVTNIIGSIKIHEDDPLWENYKNNFFVGPFIALDKCLLSSQPVKAEMCVQLSCLHWLGNFKDTCFCFVWFLANQSREQLLHKNPIPATSQSMVQIQSKSNS